MSALATGRHGKHAGLLLALVAAGTAATGCLESEARTCAFGGICPPGKVCAEIARACVGPEQLEACQGQRELDDCTYPGSAPGARCIDAVCGLPRCGNGVLDFDEECDDGNRIAGDGCGPTCVTERCGNGIHDPGESCDGTDFAGATCRLILPDQPTGVLRCGAGCTLDPRDCFRPVRLAASWGVTCAVTDEGQGRCWGSDESLRLGDAADHAGCPAYPCSVEPVVVTGLTGAVDLGAGVATGCAVTGTGALRCWGWGAYGNLMGWSEDETCTGYSATSTPVTLPGLEAIAGVAPSRYHTCAWRTDGGVRCWGTNVLGELGDGETHRDCVWTGTKTVDYSGRAVIPAGLPAASQAVTGIFHSCALGQDGSVWCWGSNAHGQLGDGARHETCSDLLDEPVDCSAVPVRVPGIETAIALAAGDVHTCAVLGDGTVQCWGANGDGQLGDGTFTNRDTPVAVVELDGVVGIAAAGNHLERGHTCAVRGEGSVWCWGANGSGQLGDGTLRSRSRPVEALGVTEAVQVVTASLEDIFGGHTCALRADGVVLCWGSNFYGQLGDPALAARLSPGPVSF